jgi:hypothetical protein
MSESVERNDFEGIRWEKELEDDSLAIVQEKIRNEFGTDFETLDYDLKGFSKENSLPFYSDLEGEIRFNGDQYEIEIERSGGLNEFEFWTDDPQALELLDAFLEEHAASNGGDEMLEPYKYEQIRDVDVNELLDVFSQRFKVRGPERRPGNGQPRTYPVRREHLDNSDDYLHKESDETLTLGDAEDIDEENYSDTQEFVPGDARFILEHDEEKSDIEVEGEVTIKPEKREKGKYRISLVGEDRVSLQYLINIAEDTLRE